MSEDGSPPPALRLLLGLLCLAAGVLPILAAFDLGPLRRDAIQGPAWLALVAGGVFVLGGLALLLGRAGRQDGPVAWALGIAMLLGFAAIGNWVAFGPGPRACSMEIEGMFGTVRPTGELSCRIAFGIGAMMVNGCLIWIAGLGVAKLGGESGLSKALVRLGLAVLLLALAPVLLLPVLYLIGRGLIDGFAAYRATGRWPRNEGFIQRMKARRTGSS